MTLEDFLINLACLNFFLWGNCISILSFLVSDLRKMATSMNRSQFNSAVLGKDSVPETEPSGKKMNLILK